LFFEHPVYFHGVTIKT